MLKDLRNFATYARGLRRFLGEALGEGECERLLVEQLHGRDEAFLRLLERSVFAQPQSPYRRLLARVGLEFREVARLVRERGVEAALEELHDRGVYVTLDEFKGRVPIEREGLRFAVRPEDFDNPLLLPAFTGRTGGSRGSGRSVMLDFGHLTHEAAYAWLFLAAFGAAARQFAIWRPVPPATSGLKTALRHLKLGKPVERWYSQTALGLRSLKQLLLTRSTVLGSRAWGPRLPMPEHVPLPDAHRVASWLASRVSEGTPALLATSASSAVRTCLAAQEHGLDISGTLLMVGGEPYTAAKAAAIVETGSRSLPHYGMAELGRVGIGCAAPRAVDDVTS